MAFCCARGLPSCALSSLSTFSQSQFQATSCCEFQSLGTRDLRIGGRRAAGFLRGQLLAREQEEEGEEEAGWAEIMGTGLLYTLQPQGPYEEVRRLAADS